jgi:phosphatidylserine/phosphatidylglycerophosphate/cardiolipin synthase-like enzyme
MNIFLAMAFFTDRDIANALILAKKRNVSVDIILSSNAQNENVKQMFKDEYISVHAFETGDERGMMHHKFCLLDNNITINGSYNYSYNASNNNVENIHISDDYSIYKQFLNEFEKLKYNIDNNISVNDNTTINHKMEKPEINTNVNQIDSFSQQLYNIVYLSAQIDVEGYKKLGYDKSKENNGSVEIFKSEFSNLKEQIRLFKLDDSLNNKKSNLLSNIQTAYSNKKVN